MRAAALLVFACLSAGLVFTQQPPDQEFLLRGYGSLAVDDALDEQGDPRDAFTFTSPEDGYVTVVAVSPDFTPRLTLRAGEGAAREIAGRGNVARLEVAVAAGEVVSLTLGQTDALFRPGAEARPIFADYMVVATFSRLGAALRIGSRMQGELTRDDTTDGDGSYIDWYDLSVPAGVRTRVDLSSVAFDTYLQVELPDGRVIENDDSDGTDSGLSFALDSDGTVRVGATSYGFASTGSYTIEVSPVEERRIRVGETIHGRLERGEDVYLLSGEPGETIAVELRSDSFDTYLELEDDAGVHLVNDDAGGIDRSRVVHEIGRSGEAVVSVSSFGGGNGPYQVEVRPYRYDGPLIEDGYELSDGEVVTGSLGPHGSMHAGSYAQRFTFRGEPGQRVEIVLRSSDFDSYLRVVTPRGEEITDDDSAGGLDSRLTITTDERGVYEVFASDLGGGSIGDYTLTFARMGEARLILATRGELTAEDEMDIRGTYYDSYRFTVTRGRPVTIDVLSDDFDGYAIVRSAQREVLYRDDDSGGSGNPRISFTPERSQTLELVVTTYSPGTSGRYEVSIFE